MARKRIAAIIAGVIIGWPIYLPILLFAVLMVVFCVMILAPLMLLEYAITGKVKWTEKVSKESE